MRAGSDRSVGLPWEVVTVREVTPDYAEVENHIGKLRQITTRLMPAKGTLPVVGEKWVIDRSLGYWTFAAVMRGDPPVVNGSRTGGGAMVSLLNALVDLGLIKDETTA